MPPTFTKYNTIKIGQYVYWGVSDFYDSVDDVREYVSGADIVKEKCTVANATKGGGTWVVIPSGVGASDITDLTNSSTVKTSITDSWYLQLWVSARTWYVVTIKKLKESLGLNITATKTLTVTDDTTLNGGTHSGNNTGDQVGDGVTITGTGTIADPFVAASSGGGHEILDKEGTPLTQRAKLKSFQEVADDAGNDTTKLYPTFKKAGHLAEYDNGNSGASKTIDFNNGQNQKITLTADCTLTLTALSDINASTFRVQLKVIQDGTGEWNLYFPAGTVFCNGAFDFSTGTADQTCLVGIYYDGTKYYIIPTLFFD